jgi:hypothetical protein
MVVRVILVLMGLAVTVATVVMTPAGIS